MLKNWSQYDKRYFRINNNYINFYYLFTYIKFKTLKERKSHNMALFFLRFPRDIYQKSESDLFIYRPPLFASVYIAALTPCSPRIKTNDLTIKCKLC